MIVIQDLAKTSDDLTFKMPLCPYMEKPFKRLLQNHWADLTDIVHEAYGTLLYIK